MEAPASEAPGHSCAPLQKLTSRVIGLSHTLNSWCCLQLPHTFSEISHSLFFTQGRRACQGSFLCKSNTRFKVERVAGVLLHLARPLVSE